jgi:hypothetical protein
MKLLSAFFVALLYSCSGAKSATDSIPSQEVNVERVQFNMQSDSNSGFPVEIHLVVAYDPTLALFLSKIKVEEYFANLESIKNDFTSMIDVFKFEFVAGSLPPPKAIKLSKPGTAIAAFFFAKFVGSGVHRLRLNDNAFVQVNVGKHDISFLDDKK